MRRRDLDRQALRALLDEGYASAQDEPINEKTFRDLRDRATHVTQQRSMTSDASASSANRLNSSKEDDFHGACNVVSSSLIQVSPNLRNGA